MEDWAANEGEAALTVVGVSLQVVAASTAAPMNLGVDVRLYGYGTAWPRGGVT